MERVDKIWKFLANIRLKIRHILIFARRAAYITGITPRMASRWRKKDPRGVQSET